MSSSPQRRPLPLTTRANARELFAIAKSAKAEFRVERLIAISVVTLALLIGLSSAAYAVIQRQWSEVQSILFGTGGACSVGIAALMYMYNRSLLFIERMTASEGSEAHDE